VSVEDYLDEREQWQRVLAWLREQGPWLLAGIALAAVGISGVRWWQQHQDARAVAAGTRYEQVIDAYSRNDLAGGERLTDELVRDFGGSVYADQAELATARINVETNEAAKAAARLEHVMTHTKDPELALMARLRLARVQIEQNKPDEALQTLSAVDAGAFAPRYAEVRGDALLAKGDRSGALQEYRTARATGGGELDTDLLDLKINELARS
jgi:predicted negative regulator of RcsB-dependent stress response